MTWYKNEEVLPAKSKYIPDYNFYDSIAKLTIQDIRPDDEGTYKCIARNPLGEDKTSADVVVVKTSNLDQSPIMNPDSFKRLNIKPTDLPPNILENDEYFIPPKVISPLQNIKCKEGTSIVFACKIDGNPKPEVINKIVNSIVIFVLMKMFSLS